MTLPFALSNVSQIVAYKRDELTADLICFDVTTDAAGDFRTWTFHEELPNFDEIIAELATLPGFLHSWRQRVVQPAFAANETLVYSRPIA